jgi:PKHD-type hydroxylase
MLLQLSDVLDSEAIDRLAPALAQDGAVLSGGAAALVIGSLWNHPLFHMAVEPRRLSAPVVHRYAGGGDDDGLEPAISGEDNALRVDVAVVVWLSAREEYDGGAMRLLGQGGEERIDGARGAGVIYPASVPRRIAPVTRGALWTAEVQVQSLVRDPLQREVLYDVGYSLQLLELFGRERAAERRQLRACHDNLLRMWAEP